MGCRIVIWGLGEVFQRHGQAFASEVSQAGWQICALTAECLPEKSPLEGVDLVPREGIAALVPDLVVFMLSKNVDDVMRNAVDGFGLPQDRVVSYGGLRDCGIELGLALRLAANTPSIVSNELLGGRIYRKLSLRPTSPLVGTQMTWPDFMKAAANPRYYLCDCEAVACGTRLSDRGEQFAVLAVGDILVNVREAGDVQAAALRWNELRMHVNCENILFLGVTVSAREEMQLRLASGTSRRLCIMPASTCAGDAIPVALDEGDRIFYHTANNLPFMGRRVLSALVRVLLGLQGAEGHLAGVLAERTGATHKTSLRLETED